MTFAATLLLAASAIGSHGDLETPGGAGFSLADLLSRGPVVLVFWNSWLPHAEEFAALLPEVEAAAERGGWPGAVIVFQERRSEPLKKLPSGKSALPVVLDRRAELVRRFQVTRAPAVLLVEADGRVRSRCGPEAAEVRALLLEMAKR